LGIRYGGRGDHWYPIQKLIRGIGVLQEAGANSAQGRGVAGAEKEGCGRVSQKKKRKLFLRKDEEYFS
jgi:hypothetical protein